MVSLIVHSVVGHKRHCSNRLISSPGPLRYIRGGSRLLWGEAP